MEKKRKGQIKERNPITFAMDDTLEPDLIKATSSTFGPEKLKRERNGFRNTDAVDCEVAGTSKKNRPTSANVNALKLSCELLRIFITEAVDRAATIAEVEGGTEIEATHLERILPQFLHF